MNRITFLSIASLSLVSGLSTVLYGPQERVMLLLTAKLAAKQGLEAAAICESGAQQLCRRFMYGAEYAEKNVDDKGKARLISDPGDIEDSLINANSILFIAYDNPIDEKSVNTLLDTAGEKLSKVVMLSKMGVTKAKGGFFGGGDSDLLMSEKYLRKVCNSKNIDLSIIRAGNLKGGGPGEDGNDFGLNEVYYNTLVDVVEASVTMAHDKFTLGADCTLGDTIEMPNLFQVMGTKSSFDVYPYDTNRIVAAGGTVAATLKEGSIEFSVSTAKGNQPPTPEDWEDILASLN